MYEQVSHAMLNRILDQLKPDIRRRDLRHFYTRLGANFYAIHSLFKRLYGDCANFESQMVRLVTVLARNYIQRDRNLRQVDKLRESDHNWFLDPKWVGMALYANAFADGLAGVRERLGYLQELGVNLVHVMPILKCPPGASDGGYAVSDFRDVDERAGTLHDLRELSRAMRARNMLLTLDVVVNHTSNQHEWAQRAKGGEKKYQDYYYVFDQRDLPDRFDATMPEVFPETAPGNFTWEQDMNRWVMTVFNAYQWDLNYRNPAVFIEMLDNLLFWANQGADILRLDAVAFLWKEIGTTSQNLYEAHLLPGDRTGRSVHCRSHCRPGRNCQVFRRRCGDRQGV
jgi:amylosucrase